MQIHHPLQSNVGNTKQDSWKAFCNQFRQSNNYAALMSAKTRDRWSCSWLIEENIIHPDMERDDLQDHKTMCSENLLHKYLPRSCFSTYNTRKSQDLQIPRCRTEFFKTSFHHASLKAWNDTPSRIQLKVLWRRGVIL